MLGTAFAAGTTEAAIFYIVGAVLLLLATYVAFAGQPVQGGKFLSWQFLIAAGLALWLIPIAVSNAAIAW